MAARRKSVLDSFAVLAFLGRERGFGKVRDLLRDAARSGEPLLMNEINIGEVYYVAARERSFERAEDFLHRLELLPIRAVPNSFPEVLEAARIKARVPISYADAFAVATAVRFGATVVTGDPDFHKVEDLVPVEWL